MVSTGSCFYCYPTSIQAGRLWILTRLWKESSASLMGSSRNFQLVKVSGTRYRGTLRSELRAGDDYSTPNDSFRLTLYSTTLPSFTIAFCPTTSTPRTFFTVFDDLFTASLIASSKPLLEVPTSSIIFPTGILLLPSVVA